MFACNAAFNSGWSPQDVQRRLLGLRIEYLGDVASGINIRSTGLHVRIDEYAPVGLQACIPSHLDIRPYPDCDSHHLAGNFQTVTGDDTLYMVVTSEDRF